MARPARPAAGGGRRTGILGIRLVPGGPGIGRAAGADPTSSAPPVEADPNFSARNRPWATRASASARHTASKTLSIVAASRSSWSMSTMSEDLPRSTGRLSANWRGSRR